MPERRRRGNLWQARAWWGVLAATVVPMVSGCGKCWGTYNCPEVVTVATTQISVPSSLNAPLTSVTTTGRCTTNFTTGDSEGPVLVSASGPGTCRVVGKLADGTEVAASLVYRTVDLACCGSSLELAGPPPSFAAADAGRP